MERLLKIALKARELAYVPYSNFAVGAALQLGSGKVITGCNVENASYGLTNCAERTALFKAVSDGERDFQAIAVVADSLEPVTPCGACRQVMAELCSPNMPVYLYNVRGQVVKTTVHELLPLAFNREALHEA